MIVKVKLFGPMAQAVGGSEVRIEIDADRATCGELRSRISDQAPNLRTLLPACRFAVDCRFVPEDRQVRESDEIALIGLTSGG